MNSIMQIYGLTPLTFDGSGVLTRTLYGYDNASRLSSVSDGTNSAAYSYLANSPLVGQIVFAHSGTTKMTTSKQYDYLNRLSSISSSPTMSFTYQYNMANQRTLNQMWDGSYWRYGYDALGQVTSGNKYWVDGTPVAGQQFDYAFDTIGNRTQTQTGGDQTGGSLRVANYANNLLNQITNRDVPGYVDIMGDALATNSVTVNSNAPYRKVEYFRDQLSVTNTSEPVWQSVTVASPGQTSVTGHAFVAQTPESFSYDTDGNLLQDGRWAYTWDGENRLTSMTSLSNALSGSQLQLAFAYDYQGRRIQKVVSTWTNGSYVAEYTDNYAYDGWNCIAILNSSLSLLNSFMWGSDLSGSMQGAGGVGGLLEVSYYGTPATNCFVAYDGNGNVSALVNAAADTTAATYEYGPFGEVIRATGPMAKVNPFRFSTKYDDDETDFLYYGYRYCNSSTGRWLSTDPLEDQAFLVFSEWRNKHECPRCAKKRISSSAQSYLFVNNNPEVGYDRLGLDFKYYYDPQCGWQVNALPWIQEAYQELHTLEAQDKVPTEFSAIVSCLTGGTNWVHVKCQACEGFDLGCTKGALGWYWGDTIHVCESHINTVQKFQAVVLLETAKSQCGVTTFTGEYSFYPWLLKVLQ